MTRIWRLLPIVLSVCAIAQTSSTSTTDTPIYITHVVVIDTETGKEVPDQTAVISGDRISEVNDNKKVQPVSRREDRRRQ